MNNLGLVYPEIALSALGLGLMVADLLVDRARGRWIYHLAWFFSAAVLGYMTFLAPHGTGSLWAADGLSQFFKTLVLATTILAVILGLGYKGLPAAHAGTFSALLLFSTAGMMFLVSATDLLLVFVSLELISISSFVLTGFERGNLKSNEGAMKYFIFGSFSSAIMIFGISLYYGAAGTTSLVGLKAEGPLLVLGLLFILLGFGFKASIAPMHFWVPDAYEGAPTPVTAYLSIAPKIATLGAIIRIFSILIPASSVDLTALLTLLTVLTMTIGNFTAFFQNNVKRLLAYSSIAQAGYMLIGLVAGNAMGIEGILLYSSIYVSMNIGAFAIAIAMGNEGSYDISAFDGLAKRSFGTALCMALFLLALAGIPPLAGFVGKFYIFASAVQSGHYYLAVIGVLNSVVSIYYYMRIVYHMFLTQPGNEAPVALSPALCGGIASALAVILLAGLYPEPLIAAVRGSAQYLP